MQMIIRRTLKTISNRKQPPVSAFTLPEGWLDRDYNQVQHSSSTQDNRHLKLPLHLIPRPAPPTPRKTWRDLKAVEKQFMLPRDQRTAMPGKLEMQEIREYACLPNKSLVLARKGKVKSSLKNWIAQEGPESPTATVTYLPPQKPRYQNMEEMQNGRAGRRQARMSSMAVQIVSDILVQRFSHIKALQPVNMIVTGAQATSDLKSVHIRWLPTNIDKSMCEETIREQLDKVKKQIRWHFTDKFSYLRESPNLTFTVDEIIRQKEKTNGIFEALEASNE